MLHKCTTVLHIYIICKLKDILIKKMTPGLLMVLEERKERIRLRNLSFMNPRGNYVKTMSF